MIRITYNTYMKPINIHTTHMKTYKRPEQTRYNAPQTYEVVTKTHINSNIKKNIQRSTWHWKSNPAITKTQTIA